MRTFSSHPDVEDVIIDPFRYLDTDYLWGVHRAWCRTNPDDPESYDPKLRGRIRVFIPRIHPADVLDTALPWAEPCFMSGGGHKDGDFVHPAYNDAIWVTFEEGKKEHPVWIGMWRGMPGGETDLPDETYTPTITQSKQGISRYPKRRIWKSKVGHIIEMGDDELEMEIVIKTGAGNKLVLRDSPSQVENGIVVRSPGIRLETASTSIHLNPELQLLSIYHEGDLHETVIGDVVRQVLKREDGTGGSITTIVEGSDIKRTRR